MFQTLGFDPGFVPLWPMDVRCVCVCVYKVCLYNKYITFFFFDMQS